MECGAELGNWSRCSAQNDPVSAEGFGTGSLAALAIAPGGSFITAHSSQIGKRETSRDYWEREIL